MNITHILSTGALAALLVAGMSVVPASAVPDQGDPSQPEARPYPLDVQLLDRSTGPRHLGRIGTQYIRGDDLTGAGAPAPEWMRALR